MKRKQVSREQKKEQQRLRAKKMRQRTKQLRESYPLLEKRLTKKKERIQTQRIEIVKLSTQLREQREMTVQVLHREEKLVQILSDREKERQKLEDEVQKREEQTKQQTHLIQQLTANMLSFLDCIPKNHKAHHSVCDGLAKHGKSD